MATQPATARPADGYHFEDNSGCVGRHPTISGIAAVSPSMATASPK